VISIAKIVIAVFVFYPTFLYREKSRLYVLLKVMKKYSNALKK
jgi:hypothetical protein